MPQALPTPAVLINQHRFSAGDTSTPPCQFPPEGEAVLIPARRVMPPLLQSPRKYLRLNVFAEKICDQ